MTTTNHRHDRRRRSGPTTARAAGISAIGAVAAMAAPATLTGSGPVDAVQRALLVAGVAFVGAHAHRRSWFIAGALVAVAARGPSLALVLAALVVALVAARPRRRPKELGAASVALTANAALWLPPTSPVALGPLVAVAAMILLVASGGPELRSRHRRILARTLAVVGVFTVAAASALVIVAALAASDVNTGTSSARGALAAVQRGDTESARSSLARASTHLGRARDDLGGVLVAPARLVPGLAQQARAVDVGLEEALRVTTAAEILVVNDYEDLRYDGALDLELIDGLRPGAQRVAAVLGAAEARLTAVGQGWLAPPLRSRVEEFRGEVADARADARLAGELLEVAPALLGGEGERVYLVVFLASAELRGAGGFIGSWAELTATDGDVDLARSGRIRELISAAEDGTRTLTGPEDYLARYGRFRPQDFLQDATFSPDWPSNADVLAQLYPQSGGRPVDGVIGVDVKGLAAILELTGPVSVDGLDEPLRAEAAVDLLNREQYLLFGEDAAREDVLAEASRATFEQLTEAALPGPRRLGDVLGPAVRGRHIQVWSPVAAEQAVYEQLEADSRLELPQGHDGLAVVQQNAGNNKLDAYLRREVDYRARVDAATGRVEATATITLHNEVPRLDLPRAVVGNSRDLPVGTNLTWLSIYSPHALEGATLDGVPVALAPAMEVGIPVLETPLIEIPPGGSVRLELRYLGGVDLREAYRFRYVPQPMPNADALSVEVTVEGGRFDLESTVGPGQMGSRGSPVTLSTDVEAEETVHVAGRVRRR